MTPAPGHGETAEFALPHDIEGLLENALIPAKDLMGTATKKFYVDGYPNLLVRLNAGDTPSNIQAALDTTDILTLHGINVLPHVMVPYKDQPYVITKKVDGVELADALSENPSTDLLATVDEIWIGLVSAAKQAGRKDVFKPSDVESACQYMLGTIDTDPAQKVWLVDLPTYYRSLTMERDFVEELLCIANGLVDIEKTAHRPMKYARIAIESALSETDSNEEWVETLTRGVRYVLEHQLELWPSDPESVEETLAKK